MIKAVFIENFMRIDARVEIPLAPVTILVGGNGSGKSSVLKGIHWAIRCAALRSGSGMTALEQMDYAPSRYFQELAHRKRINHKDEWPKILVGFRDEEDFDTSITIRSARNDAGAQVSISGPLSDILASHSPASAYIPGLAGLAETETLLASPVLNRRAASGEGGSVLRHILLEIAGGRQDDEERGIELSELSELVGRIVPGIKLWIKFDRKRDVHIDAFFWTPDMRVGRKFHLRQRRPLEMLGTGYLNVVQIFAYLMHFRPKLLLIEEPDAHLHPGAQELLIQALEAASIRFPDTQFIITSHSPNLVRASGSRTSIQWMADGCLKVEGEDKIRTRMGWGSLDKKLIIFTEDENLSYWNSILSQWPEIQRKVLLWSTFGFSGIPDGGRLRSISRKYGIKVFVHRDRDFMSEVDIAKFCHHKRLDRPPVPLWVPDGSDVESVFCCKDHLKSVLSIDDQECDYIVQEAVKKFTEADVREKFNNAYRSAVGSFDSSFRSRDPSPVVIEAVNARWDSLGGFGRGTIKGKELIEKIYEVLDGRLQGRQKGLLDQLRRPSSGYVLASSLKEKLREALDLS